MDEDDYVEGYYNYDYELESKAPIKRVLHTTGNVEFVSDTAYDSVKIK